jgi:ketosteroid isomerase-like protein
MPITTTAPQTSINTRSAPASQTPTPPPAAVNPSDAKPRFTPMPSLSLRQLSPEVIELVNLEGAFSDAVAKGGGPAFASWFADDGVALSNGKPPVSGRDNIAATATWSPKDYQLTWFAEGAQMGPSKETGFTWGHYDAVVYSPDGTSKKASGRYITFWKKVKTSSGKKEWKVALDASADEPPDTTIP